MDTDNIVIFEKDLLTAQRICAPIQDVERRNKAVANVIAAKVAAEYFDVNYDVDIQTSLHNIASIVEQFEISDIYVNDSYVDVRFYFSDDEMCVPKVHFDNGILPVAYMFVKMSNDLKDAVVSGFIYPESIDKNKLNNDVYNVEPNELSTFYDVELRLQKRIDAESIDNIKIYELLEGTLSDDEIIELFKVLIRSKHSRIKLIKAVNAQSVFNFVSTPKITVENTDLEVEQENSQKNDLGNESDDIDLNDEDLDSLFAESDENVSASDSSGQFEVYETEVTPSGADVIESLDKEEMEHSDNEEQIETLFTGEQEGVPVAKKKGSLFLPILLLLLLLCGGVYFWYMHNSNQNKDNEALAPQPSVEEISTEEQENQGNIVNENIQNEAMPVETVEDVKTSANKEESTAVAIPAIERNLDASVLVSNLKIDWEVPEGYASNTAAKRYLVKLGKIIQLNLKTELLLLNKPPLSNKITVELKFNKNSGKFEVVGIQASSGEKEVDDTILNTVKSALGYSVSTNMESFARLQGNPILIINL